jgi:hypothetical protein
MGFVFDFYSTPTFIIPSFIYMVEFDFRIEILRMVQSALATVIPVGLGI